MKLFQKIFRRKKKFSSRKFFLSAVGLATFSLVLILLAGASFKFGQYTATSPAERAEKEFADLAEEVLPAAGLDTGISFGDAVKKMAEAGVLDAEKFRALYSERGGLPAETEKLFAESSAKTLVFTPENSSVLLNLLWPLGLANKTAFNAESPLNGPDLHNFASTAGWTLGKAERGGDYFNQLAIVKLTPEEDALVRRVAEKIFRPCCGNSTFFQDCNHGSAMLGLLELGASQNLSEEKLWRAALSANSFWFPQNYLETAAYFQKVHNLPWSKIEPAQILSSDFSSASGWNQNVHAELGRRGFLPAPKEGGGGCGV